MNRNIGKTAFYSFLSSNFERGSFTNDDAVAIMLPLLKTVASIHLKGKIAALDNLENLIISNDKLDIVPTEKEIKYNLREISTFFNRKSNVLEITEEIKQKVTIQDDEVTDYSDEFIQTDEDSKVTSPVYLKNYACYELDFNHHDPITDIFILGMILASLALNLDFTQKDDLEHFVHGRKSMVFINPKIHPAIANIILGMTDLNRKKRWKDLNEIIEKLDNYRDYSPENEYDLAKIVTDKKSNRSNFILEKLRNRLFESNRKNRLLHYKPNLRFLNLTISSVPSVLNYKNIDPRSIFYWNREISAKIIKQSSIALNKYLRFQDNAYITPTLDKIRLEANKDVNEYGFSQLKLVLCFLNWYNTKENSTERIQSPLLLASAGLTKQKGLVDQYTLNFLDDEVEINPVLAHNLREIYGIKLPESIQLTDNSIEEIYNLLKVQVEGNGSGIILENIDKPRIKIITTQAKYTLAQYKRRVGNRKAVANIKNVSYSYSQENFQPYGLELFRQYIDVGVSNLEYLIDENIPLRPNRFTEQKTIEREFYSLDEGDINPFKWEFDTCNMVLGNFNYKKMSLVRDYNMVIDKNIDNVIFKNLFSELAQRNFKNDANELNTFTKNYNVVASDPTQNKAVELSKLGENYIIQGPPGTGKSQTIANLIANFIAEGKKVLFVCEKRAALDVVYHRLKNQGLDELCCLIHDSQTDKKEFILSLKSTFNTFSKSSNHFEAVRNQRNSIIEAADKEINNLAEFHSFMKAKIGNANIHLHEIFDVLIFNKEIIKAEDYAGLDLNANYGDWENHHEALKKLYEINAESNKNQFISNHPFKYFSKDFYSSNESIQGIVDDLQKSTDLIGDILEQLDFASLAVNANNTFVEIVNFLEAAVMAIPLFENNTAHLLIDKLKATQTLNSKLKEVADLGEEISKLDAVYPYWKEKLSTTDANSALEIVEKYENNFFNFFFSSFRNAKKQLLQSYSFEKHKVKPKLSTILKNLSKQNELLAKEKSAISGIEESYKLGSYNNIAMHLTELHNAIPDSVIKCLSTLDRNQFGVIKNLHLLIKNAHEILSKYLENFESLNLLELENALNKIINFKQYIQLYANQFASLSSLNGSVFKLLQQRPISLKKLQKILAEVTLQNYYNNNFSHKKYNMDLLQNTIHKLAKLYDKFLEVNGKFIIEKQKNSFKEQIRKSEMSTAGMNEDQKQFKKSIIEGRKILENEFGKTIRYKSIRDLSTLESGQIIREIKPVWLMSPLSVSDTLPLDNVCFDVVIFDEASQITLEEGLPPIYRSQQCIIVGDEMQMPPSNFFGSSAGNKDDLWIDEENEHEAFSLDADSFLTQGARKFPSIMLGWHYRSKHEVLIGFSNASFYQNQLLTIPDVKDHQGEFDEIVVEAIQEAEGNVQHIYDRPISYHYISKGVYSERSNVLEAQYIAQLIKQILSENNEFSIGVVAFSMEQQGEIENAIQEICVQDKVFENRIEEEYKRMVDNQFVGLFVKNLENVQGDERDIIIMSTCYGYDPRGKMLMNFGPINKRGGEKRLNVIFSRAKKSMCVVSSIKYTDIKNEYNDGANYFRKYLQYAEQISKGNITAASNVLNSIRDRSDFNTSKAVLDIKSELEALGYFVQFNIGESNFKCSLGIKKQKEDPNYLLGIVVDDSLHYTKDDVMEQYLLKPNLLKYSGWNICQVYSKDWLENKEAVLGLIKRRAENHFLGDDLPEFEEIAFLENEIETEFEPETNEQIQSSDYQFFRLTNVENGSSKFWEIAIDNCDLIIQYGRIGTKGQRLIKTLDSVTKAANEMEKLISQKKSRGYV